MSHPIVTEEETLLAGVRQLLEEQPYVTPPSEADTVAELVRIRDEINSAKAEDKPALLLQYNQQHALLEQLRASRDAPQVDPDSPYFAHLRLEEEGKVRDVCLGKATRIQEGVRIVDWRNAPISRLFYRYQQGEEYEEEMAGRTFTGEVLARRTVTIRQGRLQRVDAPEGTFTQDDRGNWQHVRPEPPKLAGGAGLAHRAHRRGEGLDRRMGTEISGARRRVDKHLPDIAGLIDPEQFELITQPSSGFVVIRGTAGSGKTTVALHRIAWLAFSDPQIDSDRTLFVVFSPALREYVSHVLPALGVERAGIETFHRWAARIRRRHFPKLPDRHREDTPADVVRLKLHPALMTALERQVARVKAANTGEQALDDWISVQTDLDLLRSVFDEADPGAFTVDQLQRIVTWCRDRTDEIVARLDGDREVDAALDSEDDALLLRAWQLRVGPLTQKGRPLRYRHIAIDEVQDFSPLEVRVLIDTLDDRQSITLAGDTQQHVMQEAGFTSWSAFFDHLGLAGTTVSTLKVAYRSTQEIVVFSQALLGDLREDEDPPLVTRSGPPVELFRFTDHGAAVAFLADALKDLVQHEPHASVALLTPDGSVSATYFDGLQRSEVPHLRRVVDQDFTFAPGVEITEIAQVKGLEFDYVVLVEVSAAWFPDVPSARRLLHVGATRAVHQLWITSVATSSPIVREVLGTED